jgi:type IV pilus assembly protein PilO
VFVSAVAGLGRIVTLHDFEVNGEANGRLSLNITAKTYRYSTEDGKKKKKKRK